ncbi:MAG: hypothetical protein WAX07_07205 [Candidatus Altiarchaeia archaeon]
MASNILSCKKGVTSAPFFLIVSSIVMLFTMGILFPSFQNWLIQINDNMAIKEAVKLRNSLDEIHTMGDIGSVERVDMNLPPGYCIDILDGKKLRPYRDTGIAPGYLGEFELAAEVEPNINAVNEKPNEVCGDMIIEVSYGKPAQTKNFQIYVT